MKWLLAVVVTVLWAMPAVADDDDLIRAMNSSPIVVQPYQPVTIPDLSPQSPPYVPPVPTVTRCIETIPGGVDCSSW